MKKKKLSLQEKYQIVMDFYDNCSVEEFLLKFKDSLIVAETWIAPSSGYNLSVWAAAKLTFDIENNKITINLGEDNEQIIQLKDIYNLVIHNVVDKHLSLEHIVKITTSIEDGQTIFYKGEDCERLGFEFKMRQTFENFSFD